MKRQLPSQFLERQFFGLDTRRTPLSASIQLSAEFMLQKLLQKADRPDLLSKTARARSRC
jgi:hypothetical protein